MAYIWEAISTCTMAYNCCLQTIMKSQLLGATLALATIAVALPQRSESVLNVQKPLDIGSSAAQPNLDVRRYFVTSAKDKEDILEHALVS